MAGFKGVITPLPERSGCGRRGGTWLCQIKPLVVGSPHGQRRLGHRLRHSEAEQPRFVLVVGNPLKADRPVEYVVMIAAISLNERSSGPMTGRSLSPDQEWSRRRSAAAAAMSLVAAAGCLKLAVNGQEKRALRSIAST